MMSPNASAPFPVVPRLTIERAHLLQTLAAVPEHKLTLIAAPPGYGKTTLAAQFVQRSTLPIVWHSVEQREFDTANLVDHCLAALSALTPDLPPLERPLGAGASELAVFVTDQMRARIQQQFVYVLDDVHHVIDSPGAEAWLRTLISTLPPTGHLILIGRALPTLPIMELIARREVLTIGQQQLRFTFQDVVNLAAKAGLALSEAHLQAVFSRLDGWAAGIVLALQPLPAEFETLLLSDRGGPEGLFDALAEIMLDAQPPALQDFLLSSSTLLNMSPVLCNAALHLLDSREHLTEALSRNLFVSQMPGAMVYHALFRDFLQRRLHARNPSHFRQLHADAGQWFEAENRLEEAFDHYVSAEQWDLAAAIAERSSQTLYARGQAETVLRWKHEFTSTRNLIPRLAYTCATIHRDRSDYPAALEILAEADSGFRAQGYDVGSIQVALLKASILSVQSDDRNAIALAMPFTTSPTTPPNLCGYAHMVVGMAYLQLGQFDEALEHFEQAQPLCRATGDAFALAHLLINVGLVYLRLGRFADATYCLEEVVAIRRALGGSAGIVMALNNLGCHYHLLGEYAQAWQTLQEGLQVAGRVPENRAEAYILSSLGDLQRDRGAFEEAVAFYRSALQRTSTYDPILRSTVLANMATLYRWAGKLDDAYEVASEAKTVAEVNQLPWETLLADLALGGVLLERGEIETATPYLERTLVAWRHHASAHLAPVLALSASAALVSSDTTAADTYLRLALTGVRHPANLQPLVAEIVHQPRLRVWVNSHASRFTLLVKDVQRLDAAQVQRSELDNRASGKAVPPTLSLRVWVLGQEVVERDGKVVPKTAWRSSTARALFFYLLFQGAASREQIALTFWPDSTPDQVRPNLHTALRRLRNAVGANAIRFEDDRYRLDSAIDIWCDAYEFEAVFSEAQLTSPLIAHGEALWRRAVSLYQGEFLSAYDMDWSVGYREALAQRFLDALLALGNCVRLRGDPHEAITIVNRALGTDALREDLHRALLLCYAALGDRSAIRRHVEAFTALLDLELGIVPSLETRTLIETLLR